MFEKSMNYVNWVLFITAILATLLVSFRIAQGLITGTVCIGRVCNAQASQPFWYWAYLVTYSIAIPALIFAGKRLRKEIRAYKPT